MATKLSTKGVVDFLRNRRESETSEGEDLSCDQFAFESVDNVPVCIQPGLFIGSFLAEENLDGLKSAGITHVVQVASGLQPTHEQDFKYHNVHVMDLPCTDLAAHFRPCFEFMDEAIQASGSVLVHCMAGVSRSATICIGYIMWKERVPYDQAFSRLQRVRPWVMPNEGFKRQLQDFERVGYDLSRLVPTSRRLQASLSGSSSSRYLF